MHVKVPALLVSYLRHWSGLTLKARVLRLTVAMFACLLLAVASLFAYATLIIAPDLPSIEALIDYQPKIPLRVYTADHVLIGEFGEERRDFVPIARIPQVMKDAVIAIEDDRFYEHGGVDLKGVVRAFVMNIGHSRSQGASTITMQVARTFYLTRQKTYTRKLREIVLAYKIEQQLSKDEILELYMNQIYLGERAYGFGSAARIYFDKSIQQLTLAEAAMLAGLPKAPAAANPIVNPKRATQRQQHILKRMHELGYITAEQYAAAAQEKLNLRRGSRFPVHAAYAAELVRQHLYSQYKEDTYTHGYTVITTLDSTEQEAAYKAVRQGVLAYERRHGYRGPEAFLELPKDEEERQQAIDDTLLKHPDSGSLQSAVVLSASPKMIRAEILSGEIVQITGANLRFVGPALSPKAKPQRKIRPGAVIRVERDARKRWSVAQLPEVSAALVALDAQDGSYQALVGGFDFGLNQFNHVTQAWRQPGSSIKPFIYSAALEKGFFPATMINDAPLDESALDGAVPAWNPQNSDGKYDGPVTMRTGLKRSKNLVSIRILRAITTRYAQDYIARFGFDPERHPDDLSMALGTGAVTPLQLAAAYAVFANGGYQIEPYLIQRVSDARGNVIFEAQPTAAGDEITRVLDQRNAFIMDTMLRDVVSSGTGHAARQQLGRSDLAGKTGTTNDAIDGWFAGYGGDVVAVAWMGYDKPRSLGSREAGSTVALPMWIDYMRVALRNKPQFSMPVPVGIEQIDNDWIYAEYVDGDAVYSVGVEQRKSFWDWLFRTPAQEPTVEELEKRRYEELIHGG
jgi:penicillin-binding protein 1A